MASTRLSQVNPRQKIEDERHLPFSVDAALLRELGERIVGRPYIALAELIKNAYDADATEVELTVEPERLLVTDNGHGMTPAAFEDRWMRVGSPRKEAERVSPKLKRPMTGSKGIGRLSAQFLGNELQLWTQASRNPQLYASINWRSAQRQKLITEAKALVGSIPRSEYRTFPRQLSHGTIVEIDSLNQSWGAEDLRGLAQEVWALQPPFSQSRGGFEIKLETPDQQAAESFQSQVSAYLDVWYARIKGQLARDPSGSSGHLKAELEFYDGERHRLDMKVDPCRVHQAAIEIRVYYLKYRQSHNLSVRDLRRYFNQWGGVHVYDSGFRLPYYGPDVDWLEIEMDHSHRLSKSKLLPASEQVRNGMRFLPTNSRVFGEIKVSTNEELNHQPNSRPGEVLQIQASRDRLVGNQAYDDLKGAVRTTLDWYANREAARVHRSREEPGEAERVSTATETLDDVVESLEPKLGKRDYTVLTTAVQKVRSAEHAESAKRERQTRLMASLASAGAASLAYEHEIGKQFRRLERIERSLKRRAKEDTDLAPLAEELNAWLKQAKRARGLFSPLLDEERRESAKALPAAKTIKQLASDLELILEGVPVSVDVEPSLFLPSARYSEWSAIFQNAFVNAISALRGKANPLIRISGSVVGRNCQIRIEDNGRGLNLDEAERLFAPFERGDPNEVGSGTGLGLAIIQMLAEAIGIKVAFVEPKEEMSTSLRISWRPSK